MTADAGTQAGAPAVASRSADAVIANLVSKALAQVHAGDPVARRPLAPVPLRVEATAGKRPFAEVVPMRAADVWAASAPPGRTAEAARGLRRAAASGDGVEPGRSAPEHAAQRVPAVDLACQSLRERA